MRTSSVLFPFPFFFFFKKRLKNTSEFTYTYAIKFHQHKLPRNSIMNVGRTPMLANSDNKLKCLFHWFLVLHNMAGSLDIFVANEFFALKTCSHRFHFL